MFYLMEYISPVGQLTVAGDGKNIIGLWIEGQKYFLNTLNEPTVYKNDSPELVMAKYWLDSYFAGEKPTPNYLQLAPSGGEFRKSVWKILCEIPYGEITTYGYIAKKIAAKQGKSNMSAQAVGGAIAHNPISIIIPCHRVVGSKGSLTGYAGGISTKIELLKLEGIDTAHLFAP